MLFTSSIAPDVVLPRMTAPETAGMILALSTAYHAMERAHSPTIAPPSEAPPAVSESFPPPAGVPTIAPALADCAARLERAGREVSAACELGRRNAVSVTAGKASREERRVRFDACRRAWSALNAQVSVWRETHALDALTPAQRAAFDRVLPAGAAMDLRRRGLAVWSAGSAALASMQSEGLVAVFASLGGASVLSHLQRAHADFGAALGVSRPLSSAASPRRANGAAIAAAYASAQAVLREYVLKVYASVSAAAPATERLATALLAPLLEEAARARPAAKPAAGPPVTPRKTTVATSAANDVAPTLRPTGTA